MEIQLSKTDVSLIFCPSCGNNHGILIQFELPNGIHRICQRCLDKYSEQHGEMKVVRFFEGMKPCGALAG